MTPPGSEPPATRRPKRKVDGFLAVDKPRGPSSNAVLQRVKWLLRAEKAGHTGTLDPEAEGLLLLAFGEATKFSGYLLSAEKRYRAHIQFGVTTSTGDREGAVLVRRPVNFARERLVRVLEEFVGDIEQIPPMHSALKVGGRPLYQYARNDQNIERVARPVTIHEIKLCGLEQDTAHIDVRCSKGTYIRTLAEDIGARLGCGGHLLALRRTAVGVSHIAEMVTLESLEQNPDACLHDWLLPVELAIRHFPAVQLDERQTRRLRFGQEIDAWTGGEGPHRAYGPEGLLGLVQLSSAGRLRPLRLLRGPPEPH